jgi:hypothetical protein
MNKCKKCSKKLLIPSWTVCDDCDFKSFRNRYLRKQLKKELAQYQAEQHIRKMQENKRAISFEARILIYDEVGGVVVGWKN